MKKLFAFLACALMIAASSSVALAQNKAGFSMSQSTASGGFSGPGLAVTSAKEAATMRDDAHIVLRGNIVQHLGKDKYLFKDASGTIRVEIDHDEWGGLTITPSDTVELYGEVDKDWNSVEVEVDRVVKIQ